MLVRALHQVWMRLTIADEPAQLAYLVALPIASALASVLAIAVGVRTGRSRSLLVADVAGLAAALTSVLLLSFSPVSREVVGVLYVAVLALRLAPSALAIAAGRERSAFVAFAVALIFYGVLAVWSGAATSAQGDQPHYLLTANALAHGRGDLGPEYGDDSLYRSLSGVGLERDDVEAHTLEVNGVTRPLQGYGLALLLLPGWVLGAKTGALLMMALVGAFVSAQTFLLLREVLGPGRLVGATWLLTSALAPLTPLTTSVYPNVAGAAAIVLAYRWLWTATPRRPLLAGIAAAATLFLTPRDAFAVILLVPFVFRSGPALWRPFALTLAGGAVAASLLDLAIFGAPLPFAGYALGIEPAQRFLGLPTFSFRPDIGLGGILFDRAFGIAGSAPFLFLGLAGIGAALRAHRSTLLPALVAVGGSVVALSMYRLWEGGWSPPNRYIVDVLPLWAPLVALGIAALRGAPRGVTVILVALSALASFFLVSVPNLAFNVAATARLVDALTAILVLNPLAWLPSFEELQARAIALAWAGSLPLIAICAALVWVGFRDGPVRELRRREELAVFALANAAVVAALLLGSRPEGCAELELPRCSVMVRWLPFALALATALTLLLSYDGSVSLRRHFLLWLAVPATGAMVLWGPPETPLHGFPLVLVAFGIAAHGVMELRQPLDRRSDRSIALLLGATTLAASLALLPWVRTVQPTASDEPHYLITMDSLVRDRDFDLKNNYDDILGYLDFYPAPLDARHVIGVGEAEYPIHDPGLPLLGAIPFAIARRTGVLVLMCVVAAAFAWRGYAFLRRLAFGRETALLATAAVVFLHPFFTYTTQIFPDLVAALVVLAVAELVATPTLRRMALASALVGVLPWLSVRLWLPAVGLGLVIAWWALRRRGELVRRVAAGAVPFALVVGAYAAFDYLHYRVFLPNVGYLALLEQSTILTYAPQLGLPGLLLDRTFGLLSHAPLYAIAFVGIYGLWRRWRASRSLGLATLALAWLVYFVYIGNIGYWWADGAPSSRYLLATIAFPMCALAAGLEALRGAVARAIAVAALVWSAGVTLIYAVVPNARYDLAAEIASTGGPGRLWEVVTQALRMDLGLLFPSLVRVSVGEVALAVLWLTVLLGLIFVGSRTPRPLGGSD